MRTLLFCIFAFSTFGASAQAMDVPANTIHKIYKYKEKTKAAVEIGYRKGKLSAESKPVINRLLVMSADDFARATKAKQPTRDAYLRCLEDGLARVAARTQDLKDRQEVAAYFEDLLDIVGLDTSEGRLDEFVASAVVPKSESEAKITKR
jgi:hypothetical protein